MNNCIPTPEYTDAVVSLIKKLKFFGIPIEPKDRQLFYSWRQTVDKTDNLDSFGGSLIATNSQTSTKGENDVKQICN